MFRRAGLHSCGESEDNRISQACVGNVVFGRLYMMMVYNHMNFNDTRFSAYEAKRKALAGEMDAIRRRQC